MDKITLYSTHCPKCRVVEKKLQQKNLEFEVVDAKDPVVMDMLMGKGFRQMPILQVGENMIGFGEAVKWIGAQ